MTMQGRMRRIFILTICLLSAGCNENLMRRGDRSQRPVFQSTATETTAKGDSAKGQVAAGDEKDVTGDVNDYIEAFSNVPRRGKPMRPTRNALSVREAMDAAQASRRRSSAVLPEDVLKPSPPAPIEPSAPPKLRVPRVQSVSVRTVSREQDRPIFQQEVAANTTLDAHQAAPTSSIDDEIKRLREVLRERPNDIQKHLRLRHLLLAQGFDSQAQVVAPGMDPERAELLDRMNASTASLAEALRHPDRVSQDMLEKVEAVSEWISIRAGLHLPKVALCTSIHSYGRFEEIPIAYFVPGAANRAILYCEVKNFGSKRSDNGEYETKIAHRLTLLTTDGEVIWKDDAEMNVVDYCRNRRSDFFFNRRWQLPPGIKAGDYVLKITVRDKIYSQVGEATLNIHVAATNAVAGQRR